MATKKDQNQVTEQVIFSGSPDPVDVPENFQDNEMLAYLDSITDKVFSREDVEVKTELNDNQIIKFAKAKSYAKAFKVPIIDDILQDICVYSISKNRKSRKEFTQLAQGMGSYISGLEPEGKTIKDNLLGR